MPFGRASACGNDAATWPYRRLVTDSSKTTGAPYPFEERRAWRVSRETLANGVWLRPLADVLYVMPPLAISIDELDIVMNTLAAAIDSVTRSA